MIDGVLPIAVLSVLVVLSEALPFLKRFKCNGLLEAVLQLKRERT